MIYEPKEDSFLLEKEVKDYSRGKVVLDMGAGSGILGIAALKSGAKSVVFADVDEEPVNYLKNNGYNAINSDLFLIRLICLLILERIWKAQELLLEGRGEMKLLSGFLKMSKHT